VGQGSRPDSHPSEFAHEGVQTMTTQQTNQAKPLFKLGQTVATPGALEAMEQAGITPITLLNRHQRGDWGDLDTEDKQSNDQALPLGNGIFFSLQV
jgi:hypothetical protein